MVFHSSRVKAYIAHKLREARELHVWTQEELATRSKVSRTTVANIEKEHQGISIEALYRLCFTLDISPSDLLPPPSYVVTETRSLRYSATSQTSEGLPVDLLEKLDDLTDIDNY